MTEQVEQFTVRVVRQGERYGLGFRLVHDEAEPLVEFYDARYKHTPYGQFVSRYYLNTINNFPPGVSLALDGGVSEWVISSHGMKKVMRFLRQGGGRDRRLSATSAMGLTLGREEEDREEGAAMSQWLAKG